MEDEDTAGIARHLLLADDVLVPMQPGRSDAGEMAAGNETGATLTASDRARIPEQLDIERGVGRIGRRIDMEWLHVAPATGDVVHPVVVEDRVGADQ